MFIPCSLGLAIQVEEPDPEAPTGLDYVISESTYGDSDRPPITPELRRQHLAAEVRAAIQEGLLPPDTRIPKLRIESVQIK